MRRATPAPTATRHGSSAAFTLGLGIPAMRASAAMQRHADSGRSASEGAAGAVNAAVVWPGPATGLAAIEFEMFRGRLRLSGFGGLGALRSTKRSTRVGQARAYGPARGRPPGNPPRAMSIGG